MLINDQLGRELHFNKTPTRIISVVPSITELLYDLGLREEVIAITKFCVHPNEWFRTKTRIGGTKQLKIDLIKSLQPDFIIANKEENTQKDIDALAQFTTAYISDIKTIEDAYKMINDVGEIVGKKNESEKLTEEIKAAFRDESERRVTSEVATDNPKLKTLYFIWRDPYMLAGGDTFISQMMQQAGFENAAAHLSRYPTVTPDEIINLLGSAETEILLLSSEPFPFKQKHIDEMKEIFPGKKIILVDGEMFSWYGSRMKLAPDYFYRLLANSF